MPIDFEFIAASVITEAVFFCINTFWVLIPSEKNDKLILNRDVEGAVPYTRNFEIVRCRGWRPDSPLASLVKGRGTAEGGGGIHYRNWKRNPPVSSADSPL